MRQAGAVSVMCPGSTPWRLLQAALSGLTTLVTASWLALHLGTATPVAWAFGAALAVAGAALAWWRWPVGAVTVGWDGARWTIASATDSEPVSCTTMDVMLDLQNLLLLRGGTRWVVVHRTHAGPAFEDLCTALYAQHGPGRSMAVPAERPKR